MPTIASAPLPCPVLVAPGGDFYLSSSFMSFAVCLEIADFPVFSSSSCRAFLAMAPPCCATFLLGSSPCGLVALEISVVDTSASILRTNSVFVILSRRLSFFSPLYALYSPVVIPAHAFVNSLVRIAYSKSLIPARSHSSVSSLRNSIDLSRCVIHLSEYPFFL